MKICYIDVETTGIKAPQSGLIQLAGIIEIDGTEVDSFDLLARPFVDDAIDMQAIEVNGRKLEELSTFPDPRQMFNEFSARLGAHVDKYAKHDKFWFCAYNSGFDEDHVREFFKKNGDKYYGSWFWVPSLCAMKAAAKKLMDRRHEMENFKLATVAKAMGIEVDDSKTHDGLYDVRLCREVWKRS